MSDEISRFNHEVYVGENPPEASQLFRLASCAMASAQATNTHRVMTRRPRTHFGVQEVGYLNEAAPLVFDDYPAEARRRIAVRIGRQTVKGVPLRSWSLKFFDTHWFERPGGSWDGVRDLYCFEWGRSEVTRADKASKFISSEQCHSRELYDSLDSFTVPEDTASIMAAEYEMAQVSAADCDDLLSNIGDYYSTGQLQRNFPTA